jgi:hypothetical protein
MIDSAEGIEIRFQFTQEIVDVTGLISLLKTLTIPGYNRTFVEMVLHLKSYQQLVDLTTRALKLISITMRAPYV